MALPQSEVKEWHFELPLTTEDQLRLFIKKAFGVTIPNTKVCPHHTTPWRAFADAYFAIDPVAVWKASRGFGGKTFTLAILSLTEAATLKADVSILGGSGEQSRRVHEYVGMYSRSESLPNLIASDPTLKETRFIWGNTVRPLLASQTSVRGPHVHRLREDEIDEMDLDILDASLGQPMRGMLGLRPNTVLSSTHQHANGTMSIVLKRAALKGWPLYEWCWRETHAEPDGWLTQEDIEDKRITVTEQMWLTEYDLQQPNPEARALQTGSVESTYQKYLGEFLGEPGEYIEIETPQPGARYIHGSDWAKKKDYTVIVTIRIDVTPYRLVAFSRNRREPWPVMVGRMNDRVKKYPGDAAFDGTGLGDVVGDYFEFDGYPVMMVGKGRSDLLSNYISAFENRNYQCPFIKVMYDEHLYASVDDVYGRKHLPDTIAAMAIAHTLIAHDAEPGSVVQEQEEDIHARIPRSSWWRGRESSWQT